MPVKISLVSPPPLEQSQVIEIKAFSRQETLLKMVDLANLSHFNLEVLPIIWWIWQDKGGGEH